MTNSNWNALVKLIKFKYHPALPVYQNLATANAANALSVKRYM